MFTTIEGVFDISKGCSAKFFEAKHLSYGSSVHGDKLVIFVRFVFRQPLEQFDTIQ